MVKLQIPCRKPPDSRIGTRISTIFLGVGIELDILDTMTTKNIRDMRAI